MKGTSYREIEEKLSAAPSTISRWKHRYEEDGVLGLATIHPGQPPQKLTPQLRAEVLERTRQASPDVSTHWSLRKMAAVIKVSRNLIAQITAVADLKRKILRYSRFYQKTAKPFLWKYSDVRKRVPPRGSDASGTATSH